ncbi:MAG TPA: helix-turn-helix domain-containing protein [Candidatus Binataceae bacterium]|nr:helix-turn-helix domain-containing protein [Candidatus Binataceae bacterium]
MSSRVLTVQEVSSYLRVHPSTIYRMLKKNQLPAFRVGSDWRFTVEAIDEWRAKAEAGGETSEAIPAQPVERRASSR